MSTIISPKKQLFENFARVAKALASPTTALSCWERLHRVSAVWTVWAQASGMSVANTSNHLRIMREGGLVKSRKEGTQVIYSLTDEAGPRAVGGYPSCGGAASG